jgi:hypothetical protein
MQEKCFDDLYLLWSKAHTWLLEEYVKRLLILHHYTCSSDISFPYVTNVGGTEGILKACIDLIVACRQTFFLSTNR